MKSLFVRNIAKVLTGLALIATGASCTQDDFSDNQMKSDGFKVQLSISEKDFSDVATKLVDPSNIKDLCVLQFQGGKLAKQFVIENMAFSSGAVEVTQFSSQPVSKLDDSGNLIEDGVENIIVFLANMKCNGLLTDNGEGKFSEFVEGSTTYADFLGMSYKFKDADAITNATNIPMYGSWLSGLMDGVTNYLSVTLTRAMAYVSFTVDTSNFSLQPSEGTLQGTPVVSNMKLHNVPLTLTLPNRKIRPSLPVNFNNGVWSDGSKDGSSAYPAYVKDDFVEFDENNEYVQSLDLSTNVFKFYINENARGSFDGITTYSDRKAKKDTDSGFEGITYITFDLTYATKEGKEGVASYRVNLGGNNSGDFNILGGTQYNISTKVFGIGNVSERTNITINYTFNIVDIEPIKANETMVLEDANCYMLQPSKINDNKYDGKTLVLRLSQPRNGWQWIQSNDGSGLNYVKDYTELIENGNYTIETLWQTYGNEAFNVKGTSAVDIMKVKDASTSTKMLNYFAKITDLPMPTQKNCSALIVLKATEKVGDTIEKGDVLWSWHLWFTNYSIDNCTVPSSGSQGVKTDVIAGETHRYYGETFISGDFKNGFGMMDRNLGSPYDASTYSISHFVDSLLNNLGSVKQLTNESINKYRGMYYQYSRPTPFVYSLSSGSVQSSHSVFTPDGDNFTFKLESPQASDCLLFSYGIKHPESFINSGSNVWYGATSAGIDWPEVFDPSPSGWVLPNIHKSYGNKNPYFDFAYSDASYASSKGQYNTTIRGLHYKAIEGTTVYFPASGYIGTTGTLSNYSFGYYWGANCNSSNSGSAFIFTSAKINRNSNLPIGSGLTVRVGNKY